MVIVVLTLLFMHALFCISTTVPKDDVDKSYIVIDEVIGMTVAVLPMFVIEVSLSYLLLGFVLFRIFDILKPLGIRKIDRMNTPISVLLDDVVAGVYSIGILIVVLIMSSGYS
jgi:phosphatidylglycerophosphatase A